MKPKTLILLAVAGSCGLVAMLGVQQVMQGQQTPVEVETSKVLVALENIETGMKLTLDNTAFKELPEGSVPEDAVTSEEEFTERAAKVPFMAGDMIRTTKLTEKGEWGKSIAIPAGMRVIGIQVDDSHTISGLVRPGDRVDVLVTYQGRGERGSQVSKTKTLLEYVEVFGMDDQTASKIDEKSKGRHAKIASLIVTPEQAGFVILAQKKGTLSLSWRRRGDDELAQTKDIDEKLMEELEGTVGLHDSNGSFYDRHRSFSDDDFENKEPETAHQFLNETSGAAPALATENVPPRPTWTVQIFNGGDSLAQEFELPAEDGTPDGVTSREIHPQAVALRQTASISESSEESSPEEDVSLDDLPEELSKQLDDTKDWKKSFSKLKGQLGI